MELDHDHFACLWCAVTFLRRHLVGRKPQYCSHTCRQRAYESRRRGAHQPDRPRLEPAPTIRDPRDPRRTLAYEAGTNGPIRHALRPAGLPDRRGRRQTLCGTYASPGSRLPFGPMPPRGMPCRTCINVQARHPPSRRVDHGRDLATLHYLVGRLRASWVRGDTALRSAAGQLLATAWLEGA